MFLKRIFLIIVLAGQSMPLITMPSKTKPVLPCNKVGARIYEVRLGRPIISGDIAWIDPNTNKLKYISINSRIPDRIDTYMHIIAASGTYEKLEELIKRGGDIEVRTAHGDTPLHLAIVEGNLLNIGCLLVNNADPKAQNGQGRTPFDVAQGMIETAQEHNDAAKIKTYRFIKAMLSFFANARSVRY